MRINLRKIKQQLVAAGLFILLATQLSANASGENSTGDSQLLPCPASPNCVSSLSAPGSSHAIKPMAIAQNSEATWKRLRAAVLSLPRTKIVSERAGYLHAESRSALFRFVDHLELELDKTEGVIHVRSAAAIGHSDFGVNRKRVERLRQLLAEPQ